MANAHLEHNDLASGAMLDFDGLGAVDVVCCEGTLWITVDHDLRDVVLGPGDCFTLEAGRHGVAQALGDARLHVRAAAAATVRRPARFHAASTRGGFGTRAPSGR